MNRLVVSGPLTHAEVGALCERVGGLDGECGEALVCEVGALTRPDGGTVDGLARLGLAARRAGRTLHLRHASPALSELLDLCGLAEALGVEPRRQPEQREQSLRVQERVEMGDPPVL